MDDRYWMQQAYQLAVKAQAHEEVPVGAVLVLNNQMIGEGWNQPITNNDPTAHAEIIALRRGAEKLGNYRLLDTILYVTLEPCIMCVGAMVHARIKKLVFAAQDPKTGAAGSRFDLVNLPVLNHKIVCEHGILANECGELLINFFKLRR